MAQLPPGLIAALMTAISGDNFEGSISFVEVKPGQSPEEAVEEAKAEHRKTCKGCRDEYEEELAVKKRAEFDAEAARKAATAKEPKNTDERTPIGYRVFYKNKGGTLTPINGSFHEDKGRVEAAVASGMEIPEIRLMMDLSGRGVPTVKPVYL